MTPLCGVIGSAFAAVLTAWFTARFECDPMTLWVNFIIPIGALCCGWLGSLGLVVAGRFEDLKPTAGLRALFIAIGIVSYPVLVLLQYCAITIDGTHLSSMISFGDYFSLKLNHASMTIGHGTDPTRLDLGRAGVLLQLGAAAGFVGGYAVGFSTLKFRYMVAHGLIVRA